MPIALPERLRHLVYAVEAFEDGRGQHHLRLLPVGSLQLAAYQQIEFLVGAAQLHVRFERYGVVSLRQWIEQFVHGNRFFFMEAFVEVLTLEHLRDGVLRGQTDEILSRKLREPAAVEIHHGFLRAENFENLCLIGLGVFRNLLLRQRRPGRGAARRIADHAGEISD